MKAIIIKSQSEWDALPKSFGTETWIEIRSESEVVVCHTPGSSTVTAYGSSTVTAYESSTVTACNSSTVRAYDSSTVTAYGSSTVTAYDSAAIRAHSAFSALTLLGFAVAILNVKLKVAVKSKTATVVRVKAPSSEKTWCESKGADVENGYATVFKRVSSDFKTQEGTPNETVWVVGAMVEHKAWDPKKQECGAGKFHACPAPHYCDQYRDTKGDRYVAIKVAIKDMFLWKNNPEHPNKIAFRKGLVLHECDIHGRKIGGVK